MLGTMGEVVAGIDEAGRGPLAGPIVAAAVILPDKFDLPGLTDSKLLTPQKRAVLFQAIQEQALAIGIGKVGHREIDRIGIGPANILVMELAVKALRIIPDSLFIDGRIKLRSVTVPQRAIVGGDRKYLVISAASVIAKVTRDHLMLEYHEKYPAYGFDRHKGYGTREHFRVLRKHGPCPIHRRSFEPILSFSRPREGTAARS